MSLKGWKQKRVPFNPFFSQVVKSLLRQFFSETIMQHMFWSYHILKLHIWEASRGGGSELLDRHFVFLILIFESASKIRNHRLHFSQKMALRLDGKVISAEIRENLRLQVEKIRENDDSFRPGLAIVQVGDREDSNVYIRMKLRGAEEIGINAQHIRLSR